MKHNRPLNVMKIIVHECQPFIFFYFSVSRLAFMRLKMLCDFLKVHSDLVGTDQ